MIKLIVDNKPFEYDFYSIDGVNNKTVYTFSKHSISFEDIVNMKVNNAKIIYDNVDLLSDKKYTIRKQIDYDKNTNYKVIKIQIETE